MAEEQTPDSKSESVAAEAPQVRTTITRTPDGRWQSTLSVSFQVTSTWGRADGAAEAPTQRKPSDDDTGGDGGSKTGVGAERRSGDGDGGPAKRP